MIDIRKALNDQFLTYLNEIGVKRGVHKLLLGFSGGVDSVGLALLLKHNKIDFALAHMNFQLRGEDSNRDEQFCKKFAEENDIPVFIKRVETNKIVEETKQSVQMVARTLRYDWFKELKEEHSCDFICTAHHMSDHVETIIFNLIKGTGIEGLHGILPKREDLIRPLLFLTKTEIKDFVENCGQNWREDKSNANSKYARNKIRNLILPLMKEINPNVEKSINSSSSLFYETEKVLFDRLDDFKDKIVISDSSSFQIKLNQLESKQDAFLLFYLLKPFQFDMSTIQNLFQQRNKSGLEFYSTDKKYVINTVKGIGALYDNTVSTSEKEQLSFEENEGTFIFNNVSFNIQKVEIHSFKEMIEEDSVFLEPSFFPLTLRKVKNGDRIRPFGMKKGKKKIFDLLQDENIPSYIRDQFLVLESKEEEILSVLGVRNSESLRITKFPCKLIKISMEKL